MSTAFVQGKFAQLNNATYTNNVVVGNLLVAFYSETSIIGAGTISDSLVNTWVPVVTGSNTAPWAWYAIANGVGKPVVSIADTGSNPGLVIAEYSGATSIGIVGPLVTNGAGVTALSSGPIVTNQGALTFLVMFSGASAYASTSGSTARTTISAARVGLVDKVAATGSYTETGNYTGAMTFGSRAQTFGFGSTVHNSLMMLGVGA